jgi:phosphoglycolate phosphatase-like HAD superfamily hydrolase
MVRELSISIGIEEEQLLDEFKAVHQRYGNSEQPFAILELPSVRATFGDVSRTELHRAVRSSLDAFNVARDRHLRLYPHVRETLSELTRQGVRVVGHTEAIAVNATHRLCKLGIIDQFSRIYAIASDLEPHPNPARGNEFYGELIRAIPKYERKPNPDLLRDICIREGAAPGEAMVRGRQLGQGCQHGKGGRSARRLGTLRPTI